MNAVTSSRPMKNVAVGCAVVGGVLGAVAFVASNQLLGGVATFILSVAWLFAIFHLNRTDSRMPMLDGSWITKHTSPVLYRFWLGIFVAVGASGLALSVSMVRHAV